MKATELLKEADAGDFEGIGADVVKLRHAYIDAMGKKLGSHPHVKDVKIKKAPYLQDSFKGTAFTFTYKGHPVHAEMSHSGHSIMTQDKTKKHLHSYTQLRSMKGLEKHLDTAIKKKGEE